MKNTIVAVSLALLVGSSTAMAMDHSQMDHGDMDHKSMNHSAKNHESMDHSTMNHSDMGHGMSGDKHTGTHMASEGTGSAVIHSVSKLNRTINLTHSPIPALKWPEMTMDLAVADGVDLNAIKPDDKVEVHIVLDEDKVYRIHSIEK